MLTRTRQLLYKARLAMYIRVLLFIAVPSIYFMSVGVSYVSENDIEPKYVEDYGDASVATRHLLAIKEIDSRNCTPASILEFPPDGFNRQQRQHGYILVHCVLAIYCFLLLGSVCEQYFVPTIEIICERLNMAEDIAGATFMAAASSSPELFINCVGTFVTEGDLGVGAIVGSAVFNVLAVPACCGILAGKAIELDWWSVSRDCMMYAVAVIALILSLLDNRIYWHEALLLVLMYTLYILAMVFNGRLGSIVKSGCCYSAKSKKMYTEITPLLIKEVSLSSVWSWPGEESRFRKFFWILTWPIGVLLWATIPDCRRHRNMYQLTFIMCITWIGSVSYLVAWLITIIGDTLNVPDSITGLTILAAGTSLPEAVSSVLVTNLGHGTMGISNSIGSNTFDILLCLGLPWFIKALFYPSTPGNHWVTINSTGLSYSTISLLSTLFALYASLAFNKFRLDWTIGVICAVVYIGFLVLAALIELNVFFMVNLPICTH